MATPGSVRVAFWHATVFRRFWVSNLLASFFQPMLYLLGLGIGVGALVDSTAGSNELLGGVSYVAYIAPGLMVTTAMMVAATESMWPSSVASSGTARVLRNLGDAARAGRHRRRPWAVDGYPLLRHQCGSRDRARVRSRQQVVGFDPGDLRGCLHRAGVRDAADGLRRARGRWTERFRPCSDS